MLEKLMLAQAQVTCQHYFMLMFLAPKASMRFFPCWFGILSGGPAAFALSATLCCPPCCAAGQVAACPGQGACWRRAEARAPGVKPPTRLTLHLPPGCPQECVLEKAINDKKAPGIVARLAKQARRAEPASREAAAAAAPRPARVPCPVSAWQAGRGWHAE